MQSQHLDHGELSKKNEEESAVKASSVSTETCDSGASSSFDGKNSAVEKSFWGKVIEFIEVKHPDEFGDTRSLTVVEAYVYNGELTPVEAARRKWTWKQYVFFWMAGTFNVNTWQISATGLQLGLNWWQTWICVWVGYLFVGLFVTLASRVGNMYHLSFPSSCRIAFGTYFSIWVVLNRVVMACVWYSTQAYLGGICVQLILRSIFGNNLNSRIHDTIPSVNLTPFELICFIIFWLISMPFLWFPPHRLRHLFAVKSAITPIGAFALLIWSVRKCGGNLALGSLNGHSTMDSTAKAWAVIRSIMSAMDNFSTLVLNAPDFSRFGKTPKSSMWSQFIVIPVCFAVISLFGIVCVSAAYTVYGVNFWSPLDILSRYLDSYSSGDRAGVCLIAFSFLFDQLGANLSNNAIPAGTDMTALLPKFINIRRGAYICAAISLAICPWNLVASSSKFTTALSAYAVFLSAIAGVIFADYYIVRKGYVNIFHCYTNKPGSYYMYNKYGTNWRAVVAYVVGIVPNFPGFIGSVGPTVPIGAMRVYYLNYFVGYLISAITYLILVYYFPMSGVPEGVKITDRVWLEEWVEVEDFVHEREQFEKTFGTSNEDPKFA